VKARRALHQVDYVGGGLCCERMMREARARLDVGGHLAGQLQLSIRGRDEQGDQQAPRRDSPNIQRGDPGAAIFWHGGLAFDGCGRRLRPIWFSSALVILTGERAFTQPQGVIGGIGTFVRHEPVSFALELARCW
jgi:hypothetical protein